MKIGLLSDTHSYLDPNLLELFSSCDQIWHVGDFGSLELSDELSQWKPLLGVYGNIDGSDLRLVHPLNRRFVCEGVSVWLTHIGGYPKRYTNRVLQGLHEEPPQLFICGHSHIVKVMRDKDFENMLVVNPGAAGRYGFHVMRTAMRFELVSGKIQNMELLELGLRAKSF